jgi:hypothetical protein
MRSETEPRMSCERAHTLQSGSWGGRVRDGADIGWTPLLAACALLLAGDAAAQVQVTALEGAAQVAGTPLSLHAVIREARFVEIEEGGRCTLLVSGRALVRICGPAEARLSEARGSDPIEVELRAGELSIVALVPPQDGSLEILTPTARIAVRGPGGHVRVAPGGDTVVSALESPLRVASPDRSGAVALDAGQQLVVRRGEVLRDPSAVSRENLVGSSPCLAAATDHATTLRTDRVLLAIALPVVSADQVDASPAPPVNDLMDIIRMDLPSEGLPLQAPAAPSALITELSKRGIDEEICDPITCNPVYQLDPPGRCGVPPERGCIP